MMIASRATPEPTDRLASTIYQTERRWIGNISQLGLGWISDLGFGGQHFAVGVPWRRFGAVDGSKRVERRFAEDIGDRRTSGRGSSAQSGAEKSRERTQRE